MEEQTKTEAPEPKFTQQELDKHIQDRIARERQKYADYEDLKKFQIEHQATVEVQQQKELEARKEYDTLKQKWDAERNSFTELLSKKDQELNNTKIHNALYNAAMQESAYPDAVDLIKAQAFVNKDGHIKIRGKDSNGYEVELPVEDGVKQFLESKPYLVKSTGRSGAGTGSAGTNGQQPQGQRNLVGELQQAQLSGDRNKVIEIKNEIRRKHAGGNLQILNGG